MSKKVALVTGGAGFIGSHLCDMLLEKGWKVRALDDLSVGTRQNLNSEVEFIEGDINNSTVCDIACAGVDTVFHLAAKVSIRDSVANFKDDAQVNLMGTLSVMGSASRQGVRRFILASSMGVYSVQEYGVKVREDHPTIPLSPYGIGKLTAENYLLLMAQSLNLEPVVLRLFNTYGTRQKFSPYVGVITIFITRLLKAQPCEIYGDGNQCRDFVHVSDIVNAFCLSAEIPEASSQVFNVGTGIETTVNELANILRERFPAAEFLSKPGVDSELYYAVPDISHARHILGYEPSVNINHNLDEVVDYIKSMDS